MTDSKNKNFSCDIETGECKAGEEGQVEEITLEQKFKVKLIYYTDPICSACWAIEPQLRRFKLEYGAYFDIEYKMGGLLPGWEGFADRANGISKPSDVAHHWDEVGQATGMSIDGDVWLEDPLDSSYPPSIAFKAAQKQGEQLALDFLRKIREQVFLEKKNITKEEFLVEAMSACGGDTVRFLKDYHDPSMRQSFLEEVKQGRDFGVRGFPTFIFIGENGKGFKISGMTSYENYIRMLERTMGNEASPGELKYEELDLLEKYHFLSTREIAVVLSQSDEATHSRLEKLLKEGKLAKEKQKYGDFWRIIPIED
ncbi:MAG: DsbA family protein [Bacteroidia bacterium]|nr:DsbA family protein [Bacteroidia bacterium]